MSFGKKKAGILVYTCLKMKVSVPCKLEMPKLWPTIRKGTLRTTYSGLTAQLKYNLINCLCQGNLFNILFAWSFYCGEAFAKDNNLRGNFYFLLIIVKVNSIIMGS